MSTFHTPASLRNFQRLIERIDAEAMREETSFPKSLTVTVPESFRFPVARFERERVCKNLCPSGPGWGRGKSLPLFFNVV